MTRRDAARALREATEALQAAGIEGAAGDAARLMEHAAGAARGRLRMLLSAGLDDAALARFEALVARRLTREPVSHLTGTRAFWKSEFLVSRDVLDPRPETEVLVALALEAPFRRVLDLGTGSGCILLSVLQERPEARGVGVDRSATACEVARANARRLGLEGRAEILVSDWGAAVEGRFDLVLSNPPYIAAAEMPGLDPEVRDWEPHLALTDGGDGLDAYRRILAGLDRLILPGGRFLIEIGPTQGAAVARLVSEAGLQAVRVHPDLDGRDRVVSAKAPD